MTWEDRRTLAEKRAGRALTVDELLALAHEHSMTPGEIEVQRASFARAMLPTGDPRFD